MATTVFAQETTSVIKSTSDVTGILTPKLRNIKIVHINAASTIAAMTEMDLYFINNPEERMLNLALVGAQSVFFTVPSI